MLDIYIYIFLNEIETIQVIQPTANELIDKLATFIYVEIRILYVLIGKKKR
jgi:hypothetical protein